MAIEMVHDVLHFSAHLGVPLASETLNFSFCIEVSALIFRGGYFLLYRAARCAKTKVPKPTTISYHSFVAMPCPPSNHGHYLLIGII